MTTNTKILWGGLSALCLSGALAQAVPPSPPSASAASAPSAAVRQSDFDDLQAARKALDTALRAYENGDVLYFERLLDPDVIGRARLMDALRRDANNLRQIRMHLADIEQHAGADVTVLRARWEKRFLTATNLQPGLVSGHSVFMMHRTADGWRLAAIAGDNPFGGGTGTMAQLTVRPAAISLGSLPGTPAPYAPFSVEVVDPDLAALPSVTVDVRTTQGDREQITLQSVSAGRFVNASTPFVLLSVSGGLSGNGVIDIPGATTLTVQYVDQQPGQNRPAATLTRRIPVN